MPPEPGEHVFGVTELSVAIKRRIESDAGLRAIAVRGELSNVFTSKGGHRYFSLKEGDAVLQCFAWESDAVLFPELAHGTKIVAYGSVSAYAARSAYQLVVSRVLREGLGDIHALFEKRKKLLAAEGLFDAARKRPLPAFPFRVALVSSKQAAGAADFLTLMARHRPHVRIVLCETSVQGPNAPLEIAGAIGRASRLDVDAIVVTRGGGSFEDLFAFSDERVVRAIAGAKHPVLAAIGHSVDQQLADFAADVHAETPSDAAARLGPETRVLRDRVSDQQRRARALTGQQIATLGTKLAAALTRSKLSDAKLFLLPVHQRLEVLDENLARAQRRGLDLRRERLAVLNKRLAEQDPRLRLERRANRFRETSANLTRAAREHFERRRRDLERGQRLEPAVRAALDALRARVQLQRAKLDGNDPEAILQKGYAIVTHAGRALLDPREVAPGASIRARLARGTLSARVETGEPDGNERSG